MAIACGRAHHPPPVMQRGTAHKDNTMRFDECQEGDYRIFAGALDAPRGQGYIAAVVVNRVHGDPRAHREAWRDDSLACGHRWTSPEEALSYAMTRARDLIRKRSQMLAC
jgi:hypothetical protein